ncbi:MAG: PspC domain-containing protein [Anaerolineae bacterium]
MYRSFTDRVFGGVCAGLAAALHISPWVVRVLFVVLTLLSLGGFGVVYLLLWWLVPQQSFVERRGSFPTVITVLLIVLVIAAWVVVTFNLVPVSFPAGANPFWLGSVVLLSVVFFLRQMRG